MKKSVYWPFLVHTVTQICGPKKAEDLWTIQGTTGVSKTTLICAVIQTAAHQCAVSQFNYVSSLWRQQQSHPTATQHIIARNSILLHFYSCRPSANWLITNHVSCSPKAWHPLHQISANWLMYLADVTNLQRRQPAVRTRTSCDVARSQKRTKVERCPLALSVPQSNLQKLPHSWGQLSLTKIADRRNFLASTVCSLFAGETRTMTTLTMDVERSPDTLVPCNNPVGAVQLVGELRHKTGRSGFHSQ